MIVRFVIAKGAFDNLIIEPWAEEFDISEKAVEVLFSPKPGASHCDLEIDCSEKGFIRIENPPYFRPKVLIDGEEDERSVFYRT